LAWGQFSGFVYIIICLISLAKVLKRYIVRVYSGGFMCLKDFKEFLNEYKVVPLAIAFIMGVAATALVKSVVDNLVMPMITPFVPGGAWQTATFSFGPVVIGWGALLGAVINFVVIAFVVFMIAKKVLKEEKVAKK
jgi:large conductance mechanosensitive channel